MEFESNYPQSLTSQLQTSFSDPSNGHLDTKTILKDLAAGSISGVVNVISGHPMDTVKVRMQMLGGRLGVCLQTMIAKEGLSSFFKGVYSPLYSVPFINALVFGVYEMSRRVLCGSSSAQMNLAQGTVAGCLAGSINCLIVTPVELIKCRQQMEGMGSRSRVSSGFEIAKKILHYQGVTGLYKGNLITMMREMPAYSAQFATYETLKHGFRERYGEKTVLNFVAGAIGGFTAWLVSYPQDIIKTKLQCDLNGTIRRYPVNKLIPDGGIINCAKDIIKREGFGGFWKGFSACTIRAMVSNAFTFLAYEEAKKIFV